MTNGAADSLERIVPGELEPGDATGEATLRLHLERYEWAAGRVPGGRLLDLACGVGYGTALLADASPRSFIVGADLSRDAVEHARRHYARPRIAFVRSDGAGWASSGSFDGIVCLETLEHVPDPETFFRGLVRVLRPGGTLVTSVPVTPSVDANPHHLTDFTEASIQRLGRSLGLEPVDSLLQVQPYDPFAVLARRERRTRDLRAGMLGYYARHPGAAWRRLVSTLRHGFTNRYLTVAWRRSVGS